MTAQCKVAEDAHHEATMRIFSSLVAAISIIERSEEIKKRPSQAVASDTMFRMMLADYKRAADNFRQSLLEKAVIDQKHPDTSAP